MLLINRRRENKNRATISSVSVFSRAKSRAWKRPLSFIHVRFSSSQNHHCLRFSTRFRTEIYIIVNNFVNELYQKALPHFGKPVNVNRNTKCCHKKGNKWFDNDCKKGSKDFKSARKTYNRNKTLENKERFTKLRTKYNKTKRKAITNTRLTKESGFVIWLRIVQNISGKKLKNCIRKRKTCQIIYQQRRF